MGEVNRRWLLKQRPEGALKLSDFEYVEGEMPAGELKPDEILVRNVAFLCAPLSLAIFADSAQAQDAVDGDPGIESEIPDIPATKSSRSFNISSSME